MTTFSLEARSSPWACRRAGDIADTGRRSNNFPIVQPGEIHTKCRWECCGRGDRPAAVLFAGAPVAGCCPGSNLVGGRRRTITRTIARQMTSPTRSFQQKEHNSFENCNVGASGDARAAHWPAQAGARACTANFSSAGRCRCWCRRKLRRLASRSPKAWDAGEWSERCPWREPPSPPPARLRRSVLPRRRPRCPRPARARSAGSRMSLVMPSVRSTVMARPEAAQGNFATLISRFSFCACVSVRPHQAISGSVKTTAGMAAGSNATLCPAMASTAVRPSCEALCASMGSPTTSPIA